MSGSARPGGKDSVLLQLRPENTFATDSGDASGSLTGYTALIPSDETESEEAEHTVRNAVLLLIESRPFFVVVTSAILSYTLLMACEASYPSQKPTWRVMEVIYFAIFFIELALRLYAYGWWNFFTNEDKGWNIFDFIVVSTTACDMLHSWLMTALGKDVSQSTVVSVFRAIRMFRILRSCRVIKHIKSLNLLLRGFLQSMQAAFWIATLLLAAVFIGAIICTSIIGHRAKEWGGPDGNEEDVAQIELLFGTLVRSMITMFQLVTLDNWGPIIWLVGKEDPGMMVFFIAYSLITAFAMVALLTGIMTDQIQQASTQALNEEEELALQAYVDGLREAFFATRGESAQRSLDDGLTFEELTRLLGQKEVNEVLLHDQDPDYLADVFRTLDLDGDGHVTWDEFRHGLWRIRGLATARQLYMLKSDIVRTTSMLEIHDRGPSGSDKSVLAQRMESLEGRLRKLESRCKAAASASPAPPPPRMVSMSISPPRACSTPASPAPPPPRMVSLSISPPRACSTPAARALVRAPFGSSAHH